MKLEILQRRARLLTELRACFVSHGYFEVQTPVLSRDCCVDAWIEPFVVPLNAGEVGYLQTSPEFALKRLLCARADKIFEVARVFRKEESGPRHNPEFTMIEWYQCHVDHHVQMDFVEQLVSHLAAFSFENGWNAELTKAVRIHRLSYQEAFQRFAGICPFAATLEELADVAGKTTATLPNGIETDRDGLLNLILADQTEPGLKSLGAVFLYDYPASQAALAKIRNDRFPVAERFELYLNGVEICNGYHELTDPIELKSRMQQQNQKRLAAGLPEIRSESRLQQTMSTFPLPPSSGVALGWDRLVMWCLSCDTIQEVIAFPFEEA
ncbi:MAG TPA: EF-P lysine aminoacylase EpmA [Planctomicrobium sp.]|nr:EF-P lysine aminoacylase EpmA [Planctomicrobium sp.]